MRIAKVIGAVTLNRWHPSFSGATLKVATPMMLEDLAHLDPEDDSLVVYDQLGAGQHQLIMVSEGAEAAQVFRPELKPVDAYNAGILDELQIHDLD
jgi:microcompartment protein CcmK/EutM